MAQTYADQLDEVQAAISRLLNDGQSWERGERSRNEAQLEAREKRLRVLVDRETRGGMRVRRAVARG